jgi:hypothetical protein
MLIYKGSSALSALLGAAGGTVLWRRDPRLHAVLGFVCVVASAKTFCDALGYLSGFSSVPNGVQVAWQAHVIGGVIAIAWLMLQRPPAVSCPAQP